MTSLLGETQPLCFLSELYLFIIAQKLYLFIIIPAPFFPHGFKLLRLRIDLNFKRLMNEQNFQFISVGGWNLLFTN